jgi:hypothetical protein
MSHTPGFFSAQKNIRSTGWYIVCEGVELSTVNERLANLSPEEAKANANLFAAAPDLLAACKAFDVAMCNGSREELIEAAVAARAAIAKAEGT